MKQLTQPNNKKPTIVGVIVLLLLTIWTVSPIMLGVYLIKVKAELKAEREKATTLYEIVNKFTDGIMVIPEISPMPEPTKE